MDQIIIQLIKFKKLREFRHSCLRIYCSSGGFNLNLEFNFKNNIIITENHP